MGWREDLVHVGHTAGGERGPGVVPAPVTTNGHRKRGRGVRALTREASYMRPEDQDALRAARRFLVDGAK